MELCEGLSSFRCDNLAVEMRKLLGEVLLRSLPLLGVAQPADAFCLSVPRANGPYHYQCLVASFAPASHHPKDMGAHHMPHLEALDCEMAKILDPIGFAIWFRSQEIGSNTCSYLEGHFIEE